MALKTAVTSYAEVWIEITAETLTVQSAAVTSYAEVWIEICGDLHGNGPAGVTSYAEVWIEITADVAYFCKGWGHLLRGGVD